MTKPIKDVSAEDREEPATIIVSNRRPPATGGGPMGVLRLIAEYVASDGSAAQREVPTLLGSHSTKLANALEEFPEPRRDLMSRYRLLRSHISSGARTRYLQFEFPFASLALRLRYPRQVHLAISEHSRGGVDVERRTTREPLAKRVHATLMTRISHTIADEIIWPSYAAIEVFIAHHAWAERQRSKHRVIHNGVPNAASTGRTDRHPTSFDIAIVASSAPEKNVPRLIEMIDQAAGKIETPVRIRWVGGPTEHTQTTERTPVDLMGIVKPVAVSEILDTSTALVTFPKSTIFDLSILEAMARGLPVLAPRLPGFIEALGEDYPLYFSTVDELSSHLNYLSDPAHAEAIGTELKRRFQQRFTVERMTRAYLHGGS